MNSLRKSFSKLGVANENQFVDLHKSYVKGLKQMMDVIYLTDKPHALAAGNKIKEYETAIFKSPLSILDNITWTDEFTDRLDNLLGKFRAMQAFRGLEMYFEDEKDIAVVSREAFPKNEKLEAHQKQIEGRLKELAFIRSSPIDMWKLFEDKDKLRAFLTLSAYTK